MRMNTPVSHMAQTPKASPSTQISDAESPSLRTFLSKKKEEMKECVSNATEIIRDIQNAKREKTGEVDIMVTLLNSGNTDGLIRSDGKIVISGIDEPLDIIYQDDPKGGLQGLDYTPAAIGIEKRSMISVTFSLDDSTTSPAALKTLRESVKNRARIEFSVELKDFRDQTIERQKEIIVRSEP